MDRIAQPDDARFWDRIARKYARDPIRNLPAYEATLARTRAYLRSSDKVLEIGCGTASTALILAPDVAHYTASDFSAEMVEIGREKTWETSAQNIDNVHGVIGSAGLDGRYDAILAFNVLHLLPDTEATIERIHAQLPPGGYFISKTPAIADGAWWMRPLVRVMVLYYRSLSVRFLSRADLQRMMVDKGFSIVETGDYSPRTPSHFIVAQKPPAS